MESTNAGNGINIHALAASVAAEQQPAEGSHPGGHALNAYATSGSSPPKRAAIQPILDRVRTTDIWVVNPGKSPAHRATPLTDEHLKQHFAGTYKIGFCPIQRGSSTTRIALFDLDSHKGESTWAEMVEAARGVMAPAEALRISLTPFRSSGGSGIHLIALWNAEQDARSVRAAMVDILAARGLKNGTRGVKAGEVEVFPKQDSVPDDGWGSMFVVPGSGKSAPLDPETLEVIHWAAVQWTTSDPVPLLPKVEYAPPSTAEQGTPEFERVRDALSSIDPNTLGYGGSAGEIGWLEILFAVHAGTNASDEGLALMLEWSSKWRGFDPVASAAETEKQWRAARIKAGGIGAGTLFRAARKAGWKDPAHAPDVFGLEVLADDVDVEAEKWRLVNAFAAGAQTDEDCRSLLTLPGEVQTAIFDSLDLLDDEARPKAERAIGRAKAEGQAVVSSEALLEVDFDMNDAGNVALLVRLQNGNMRYDTGAEQFMFWRDGRWERDEHGTLLREATKGVERYWTLKAQHTRSQTGAAAQREAAAGVTSTGGRPRMDGFVSGGAAATLEDRATRQAGWAKACGNLKQINAIGTLAARDAQVVIDGALLDGNPHLLGVANGVVDLRTGQLPADARAAFVTRRTPVAFSASAKAPRWEQFQQEIAGLPLGRAEDGSHPYSPRPALVAFKQRWAGSMLIGENVGAKFYTATGEGSNGKSLELETYVEVMGPLAVKLPQGAFIAGRRGPRDADAASPTLMALRGVRLALASETEEGAVLDTGDVKAVTGDAELMARGLHQNATRFRLQATAVLLTNHPPTIKTVDNAITGRVAIVPYERTWNRPDDVGYDPERPDADTGLKAALREEAEGILAWMVRGAVEVLSAGGKLNPPPEVTAKTEQYLQDQSVFGVWFAGLERCDHSEGMKSNELLEDLRRYAQSLGRPAGREAANDQSFGRALAAAADREGLERNREVRWPLRSRGLGL